MDEERLNQDGEQESLKEEKPEITWEEVEQGLYKDNTPQPRGEYHEQTAAQNNMYQQNTYGQNAYQQTYGTPQQPREDQGFGIASLVLGVASLVLFCSCINFLTGILAIVFGIIQLTKTGSKKGMAIAGIIMSAVSFVVAIVFWIILLLSSDFQESFERAYRNGLNDDYYSEYNFPDFYNDYYDDNDSHHDGTF